MLEETLERARKAETELKSLKDSYKKELSDSKTLLKDFESRVQDAEGSRKVRDVLNIEMMDLMYDEESG
jgi:hypothetical protein